MFWIRDRGEELLSVQFKNRAWTWKAKCSQSQLLKRKPRCPQDPPPSEILPTSPCPWEGWCPASVVTVWVSRSSAKLISTSAPVKKQLACLLLAAVWDAAAGWSVFTMWDSWNHSADCTNFMCASLTSRVKQKINVLKSEVRCFPPPAWREDQLKSLQIFLNEF